MSRKVLRTLKSRKSILAIVAVVVIALIYSSAPTALGISTSTIDFYLNLTMIMATPLILPTLGEIIAELSGVLNLGLEGIMASGAAAGVVVAYTTQNAWLGLLASIFIGMCLALFFDIAVITFGADQIPTGLGLFFFGLGLSGVIGDPYAHKVLKYRFDKTPIPVLKDIPLIGKFLFSHDCLVYITLILVVFFYFLIYKTKIGLVIRAVGEDPGAADAAGHNVFLVRFICVIIGGALAGMGGGYLSLAFSPGWTAGMSAGRGWIAICLTIFSLWNPAYALIGGWLFGGIFATVFSLQGMGVPPRILLMLPYLLTLVVLALILIVTKGMKGAPSALGIPYSRE